MLAYCTVIISDEQSLFVIICVKPDDFVVLHEERLNKGNVLFVNILSTKKTALFWLTQLDSTNLKNNTCQSSREKFVFIIYFFFAHYKNVLLRI